MGSARVPWLRAVNDLFIMNFLVSSISLLPSECSDTTRWLRGSTGLTCAVLVLCSIVVVSAVQTPVQEGEECKTPGRWLPSFPELHCKVVILFSKPKHWMSVCLHFSCVLPVRHCNVLPFPELKRVHQCCSVKVLADSGVPCVVLL